MAEKRVVPLEEILRREALEPRDDIERRLAEVRRDPPRDEYRGDRRGRPELARDRQAG